MRGPYYCLFTAGLLLTAGVAALLPVRYYMEQKLSYFVFPWPVTEMVCSDRRAGHDKQSDGMEDV